MQGLKVVSAKEFSRIDKLALSKESEFSFIKNVGKNLAKAILEKFDSKEALILFGKGYNGADGLCVGINLLKEGYKVRALEVFEKNDPSLQYFIDLFKEAGGRVFRAKPSELAISKNELIIDAIFGTGFHGKIKGELLNLINKINSADNEILSIDIPSGLDGSTGKVDPVAIKATYTFFLELPKTGFFINDGFDHVGKLERIQFGLKEEFLAEARADFYLVDESKLRSLLPRYERTMNKYSRGFVVGFAGSKGMEGAANLSGRAALRSGAGIVKLLVQNFALAATDKMADELVKMDLNFEKREELLDLSCRASSLFIGPGLGRNEEVADLLLYLLPKLSPPTVLDADALYFLANNLKCPLPPKVVLTPHRKEMLRLLKKEALSDEQLLAKTQDFSEKHKCTLILKGAPTIIFQPKPPPLIVYQGSCAMATAGTGDVLTGVISALLAQKLSPYEASVLGVYLHAIAGEEAAEEKTNYSMIASDLIEKIPRAFLKVLDDRSHQKKKREETPR